MQKFLRFSFFLFLAGMLFSSCQKEIGFEASDAIGTLKKDASGDCLPVLINGTYKKDTLLNFTNYIDIQVDATQIGSYDIRTDTLNGYAFSATGSIAVTGVSTVRLFAAGRPISGGVDVFTVKFSGTSCEINVIVTGPGSGGTTTNFITATIDGTVTNFNVDDTAIFDNVSFPGFTILDISGLVSATGSEAIDFGVATMGTSVAPGTYNVNTLSTYFAAGDYVDPAGTDFNAITGSTNPNPPFTITISTITATRITGTFSGALFENGTGPATKTITAGSFSVPRQ